MHAHDLSAEERRILFGLVGRLAAADGSVAAGESQEIADLGEEIGCDPDAAMAEAKTLFPTLQSLLDAVGGIEREEARQLIRTVLFDLAASDGDRGDEENAVLAEVTRIFART